MKHLLAILSILPFLAIAQNISVKSFQSVPEDLTARVTHPLTDQNGEKCALIKVRTTQSGFVFEGDMLGLEKTIQDVGEYWLYLPHGAKKITIKHAQLGILDNYIYPEPIKEATVYLMELTTGKVITTVVDEDIKTSYLIIKTDPEGADIYIDETYMGVSPFNKKMTAGKYNYRVEMPMYNSTAGKIEITGVNPREEVSLTLNPAFGYAQINTIPEPGATVTIDGELLEGKTPVKSKKLSKGTHRLLVKLPMYQPVSQEFTITEGQTLDLNISIQPSYATVTIYTDPPSDVFIDGERVNFWTHTGRVMEGFHSFSATKEKYNEAKEQIELKAGENKTINMKLLPKTGALDIMTNPMEATINLDGVTKGKSPNKFKDLLIGDYRLTIEKKGYTTIEKTITINENKTTEINETLIDAKKKIDNKPITIENQQKKETIVQPQKNQQPNVVTLKRTKNTFYLVGALSAGAAGYFAYSANNLYKNEYPNATSDATKIHQQIERQDKIWQVSLGISAASLLTAVIFQSKENKTKRNLKATLIPYENGAGLNLSYKF